MLVQMGAAVNISSRSWNYATSLHYCSQLGKLENLKLLLKYGANVFIKDKCGQTARERARKHPACEKLLQDQEGLLSSTSTFFIYTYDLQNPRQYRRTLPILVKAGFFEILANVKLTTPHFFQGYLLAGNWYPLQTLLSFSCLDSWHGMRSFNL